MTSSSAIKIMAAFVGGIVAALGSALLYIRLNDPSRYQPAVPPPPTVQQQPASVQPPPDLQPPTATPVPDDRAPSEPAPAPSAAPRTAPLHKVRAKKREQAQPEPPAQQPQPSLPPIQIAQNTPLSIPSPAPTVPLAPIEQAPPMQPHVVTLPAGLTLFVRLGETLSTNHNYTGDTFRATLEVPIIMDGFIIAEKGSKVLGRIMNAEKAGHLSGAADLTLALTEIHTTDGQTVRVETNTSERKGPSNTGADAAKIAGGAALGAIIGALAGGGKGAAIGAGAGGAAGTGVVLATRGRPAVLESETKLTFQLSAPITITEKLHNTEKLRN